MKYIFSNNLSSVDNMILDSYLFHKTYDNYLRIYQWINPTISLGVKNKLSILNLEYLKKHNIEVVYRETGGGAIFHQDDLCFSVIISNDFTPKENYAFIKNIFQKVLTDLNLNITKTKKNNSDANICFLGSNQHELSIDGKKIIAIAQKMKNRRFLVQGSIQLKTNLIKNIFAQDIVQHGLDGIDINLLIAKIYNNFDIILKLKDINIKSVISSKDYISFRSQKWLR